jgi:hypothetical protein
VTATLLGTAPSQVASSANWVSDLWIVGYYSDGTYYACLWDATNPTAAPTQLAPIPSQTFGQAESFNATHVVGGAYDGSAFYALAWAFSDLATAITLGAAPGQINSNANAATDTWIVGYSQGTDIGAARWDATNPTAAPTLLTRPVTATSGGQAFAIDGNNVVGIAGDAGFRSKAVLWDASAPATPGVFLGEIADTQNSDAYGVSGNYIVGELDTSTTNYSVLWLVSNPTAAPTILGGQFDGQVYSGAFSVSGTTIVGEWDDDTREHAVYWDASDPTASWTEFDHATGETDAYANATAGSTASVGVSSDGSNRAVLWSTPPPPTDFTVYINSVVVPEAALFKVGASGSSLIKIEVISPGVATATLRIIDQNNSINVADNDPVLIYDPTAGPGYAFQGSVQRRTVTVVANYRIWDIYCADLNTWMDQILVGAPDGTQFLEDPPGTFTPYDPNAVSLTSDSATVQALFANYAAFLGINTTLYVETVALNLTGKPIRWNTVTLRSALNDIVGLVNNPALRYWIDANKYLHWTVRAAVPPVSGGGSAPGPLVRMFPFGTTISPTATLTDSAPQNDTDTFDYEDLKVEYDDSGWADLVYVNGATTYTEKRTYIVEYIGGGLYQTWTGTDYVFGKVQTLTSLTVRDTASDSGTNLGTVASGSVQITTGYNASGGSYTYSGTQTDWYSINFNSQTGWIHAHGTTPYQNSGLVTGELFTCLGTVETRDIAAVAGVDTWRQTWKTGVIGQPNGIRYDPDTPGFIYVVDGATRMIYTLRQSDRVITASVYIGKIIPTPLGLSGDPGDSTVYWVLNAPWQATGSTGGNYIAKVLKSTNAVVASYTLAAGRWSAIKVSASYIWLTNLDTDKIHKFNKSTGTQIASYSISYLGVAQTNPTGMWIDGTTIGVFFLSYQRFLKVDESAPTVVTGVQSTSGYQIYGGEIDTTTHADLYSDTATQVLKFNLHTSGTPASTVTYYVIDQPGTPFDKYWIPALTYRSALSDTVYTQEIGGSGWADDLSPTTTTVAQPRQRLLTSNVSDSQGVRDSIGSVAIQMSSQAVIRGSCAIYVDFGGWLPGQTITVVSVPIALNGDFLIQKVTTEFLSGRGDRKITLEWGNAPIGTIGLRRGAQVPPGTIPRRPAQRMLVTVSNSAPGAGGTLRVYAQAVDMSGNPWPISGKTVIWSFRAYDETANEVTAVANVAFSPTTSTTNIKGEAWTDVTLDTLDSTTYYFSASMTV